MSNESSRDFGAAPTHANQGGDRRDPGAEALLELARLIGGPNDPFGPQAPRSEQRPSDARLGDVTARTTAAAAPFDDRTFNSRRAPDFGARDSGPRDSAARPSGSHSGGGFDFPALPDRGEYPVAPNAPDVDSDYTFEGRRAVRAPAYRRRHDDTPPDYAGGEYEAEGYEAEDFDEGEEQAPRRRPTKLIIAVLGLTVFGSAAVYGYRVMMGAGPAGPTPVIRADNTPTKITRMSDVRPESGRSVGERVTRREEDPVEVAPASAGAGARSEMLPGTPGDTKRVHTVPIRVDQGTAASPDRPASRAAAAAPVIQAPAAPRQVAAAPSRQVAAVSPPQPPAPQRQVAAAPADTSAAAPVESGGYVVQITAVHSEADAQSEYRRLQAKYSSVLSGHQPMIRRKDQGDRGVFFVAQVGPFGAKSEAEQLCGDLKAAGGTCFVQRN